MHIQTILFLFEITDAKDVHIIREELGETLIGCIDVTTGRQFSEAELDEIGKQYGVRRPETLKNITFGELKGRLKMWNTKALWYLMHKTAKCCSNSNRRIT